MDALVSLLEYLERHDKNFPPLSRNLYFGDFSQKHEENSRHLPRFRVHGWQTVGLCCCINFSRLERFGFGIVPSSSPGIFDNAPLSRNTLLAGLCWQVSGFEVWLSHIQRVSNLSIQAKNCQEVNGVLSRIRCSWN